MSLPGTGTALAGSAKKMRLAQAAGERVVDLVRQELRSILNFTAEPLFTRVHRWASSMAQYEVGHAARVESIRNSLQALPGLFVAGNAWSGIGISDCVRTGRTAAENAMKFLSARDG